jgi:hypothetical protein
MKQVITDVLKSKWVVIGCIVTIVLVIYLNGRAAGRRSVNDPSQIKLPKGSGPNIPVDWSPAPLVEKLYKGLKPWFGGEALWDALVEYASPQLTNAQFIAVYSGFNQLYYKDGYGTLREWIENEPMWGYFMHSGDPKGAILNRMENLNLL